MKINDIYQKNKNEYQYLFKIFFFMYKFFLIILAKIQLLYNVFLFYLSMFFLKKTLIYKNDFTFIIFNLKYR